MSSDVSLCRHEHEGVIHAPVVVIAGLVVGSLIWVGAQAK
jgi:hypothetical protein